MTFTFSKESRIEKSMGKMVKAAITIKAGAEKPQPRRARRRRIRSVAGLPWRAHVSRASAGVPVRNR